MACKDSSRMAICCIVVEKGRTYATDGKVYVEISGTDNVGQDINTAMISADAAKELYQHLAKDESLLQIKDGKVFIEGDNVHRRFTIEPHIISELTYPHTDDAKAAAEKNKISSVLRIDTRLFGNLLIFLARCGVKEVRLEIRRPIDAVIIHGINALGQKIYAMAMPMRLISEDENIISANKEVNP